MQYPLRPGKLACLVDDRLMTPRSAEFIESTWYLYRVSSCLDAAIYDSDQVQATRDPFYLDVGERVLHDLFWRAKSECGLAGIANLETNKRDDRMESFVLSETLKVSLYGATKIPSCCSTADIVSLLAVRRGKPGQL
jgi:hypothetical protein